ncbi:unnamed protein product [Angiostrongylus costaricensis]|uniref:EGF-like domain-containing protein n=1 Tax=Angiostrongylus costaricensis TaxID=334426 RepID=A0A158PDB1_ANGCS|nr:unnamed protein product [Angiostrongylus costaricensis]
MARYVAKYKDNSARSFPTAYTCGPEFCKYLSIIYGLETSVISTWTSLEVLTLNSNNLTTLGEISTIPNLRLFRIGENPWHCDCRIKWMKQIQSVQTSLVKCMRPAFLHGKTMDNLDESLMKCSGIEKRDTVSCADVHICPPACLCTDSTVDCRDRGLSHVPANLPSSTTELRLEQNQITIIPPKAFHNLRKLKRLDLSKNNIVEVAPYAFYGLQSLNSLVLYGNNLTDLPIQAFYGLNNLQLLLLNANQLRCLRSGTFDPLTKLNLLSLYDNQIKSISNSTFYKLLNLQTLHLAKNPLICDCNMEWLAELQKAKGIETSGARCESPRRVARKRFASLPRDKFRCKGSEVYQTHRADQCFIDAGCPLQCDCQDKIVDCSNKGLTEVPNEVPQFATELNLSNNKITSISSSSGLHRLQNLVKLCVFLIISGLSLPYFTTKISFRFQGSFLEQDHKSVCYRKISGNDFLCNCQILPLVSFKLGQSNVCVKISNFSDVSESICADNGDYCPLGCSCHDTIVRCSKRNLRAFPVSLPVDTTELFLDSNNIDEISTEEISRLTNLVKLDMSHNIVESIEDYTFVNLTKLSTLILSYNKISCIQPRAFAGLNSLRILSLHGNDISLLPETAFESLGNITHIAMGSNSLYCDCRMSWFSRWIKTKFVEAGIALCVAPTTMANQLLLTARSHQFQCSGVPPDWISMKCNKCFAEPCKNGALCKITSGRSYQCHCASGYHGKHCEDKVDACYGHPCLNNAVCKVIQEGRFTCICPKGFKGDHCEVNIDDCEMNKCQNGAQCIDMVNSYRCECAPMYGGKYCEEKLQYCSKQLNPCQNGAKCQRTELGYKCDCLPGFTGYNCSTNIDDCRDHKCRNNGICVDGVTSYSCKCVMGYTGHFCDIPPSVNVAYPNTAQCHTSLCGHGSCYNDEKTKEYECRCYEGYSGERCDQIHSIGLAHQSAYVALEHWDVEGGNLTFTIRTRNKSGVIAYYGDHSFLSAELYDGRVKVVFYIGNHPASHMYSFPTVNDGLPHKIEIIVQGKNCSLSIDNNTAQSVENGGKIEKFEINTKQNLYIGGLPPHQATRVKAQFHVRHTHSLKGTCTKNFPKFPVLFYTGVDCGRGSCQVNRTSSRGFHCYCEQDYSGKFCQQRAITCNKEKHRRHHVDGDCRSIEMIRIGECVGYCGEGKNCCDAVKTKRRPLKMMCQIAIIKNILRLFCIKKQMISQTNSVLGRKFNLTSDDVNRNGWKKR